MKRNLLFILPFLIFSACRTSQEYNRTFFAGRTYSLYIGDFDHHRPSFEPFLSTDGTVDSEGLKNPDLQKIMETVIEKQGHLWVQYWYRTLKKAKEANNTDFLSLSLERIFSLEVQGLLLPFSPNSIGTFRTKIKAYRSKDFLKDSAWYVTALRKRVAKEANLPDGGVFTDFRQEPLFNAVKAWSSSTEEVRHE
jgi:hypothetical protein